MGPEEFSPFSVAKPRDRGEDDDFLGAFLKKGFSEAVDVSKLIGSGIRVAERVVLLVVVPEPDEGDVPGAYGIKRDGQEPFVLEGFRGPAVLGEIEDGRVRVPQEFFESLGPTGLGIGVWVIFLHEGIPKE